MNTLIDGMLRRLHMQEIARKRGGHIEWEGSSYRFVPHFDNAGALARSVSEWREEMELAREEEKLAKSRARSYVHMRNNHLDEGRPIDDSLAIRKAQHDRREKKRQRKVLRAIRKGRTQRLDTLDYRTLDRRSQLEVLANLVAR